MTFWDKYLHATGKNKSYVCVGLDSDPARIPAHLTNCENPIFAFNKEIIDATKDIVGVYKPNFAFYAAAGKKGLDALEKTMAYIPEDIPVIVDCKVGDIGNTMKYYGKAFLEEMNADSITVNPLMGHDVLKPLTEYPDKMKFILVLTSNPTSSDFLKPNDLYKKIAKYVAENDNKSFGAVVGATNSSELKELRELMPETVMLVPGIGAQGGSLEEVMLNASAGKEDPKLLINSSRGIIFASSGKDFAEAARAKTLALRDEINSYLK
ncbi:MAG: orotidine-5'-phosphate decarboxylase [Candidatus Cloacimonadota bacterium]|nr:MAG: orotidine-5'-phosphate decarboxylase [Candidatus Cloacimonadota bacterium]